MPLHLHVFVLTATQIALPLIVQIVDGERSRNVATTRRGGILDRNFVRQIEQALIVTL